MRKSMPRICVLLCSCLLSISVFSQTSWKGTVSTLWSNALNWTNGVPDITKDAILGDASFTGIYQPKINVASVCKNIIVGGAVATNLSMTRNLSVNGNFTIQSNATITHPSSSITLYGNWINDGTYTTTATGARVIFAGPTQSIGGSVLTTFRRVTITAASVTSLATNISIDGTSCLFDVSGTVDPGMSPTYTVTNTGTTKFNSGSTLKINAATFTGNYILTGSVTFYGGSVTDYSSTVTNQTISSAYSYSTLKISGSGTKSLAANLPLLYGKSATSGNILVTSGIFDIGTFTCNRATNVVGGTISVSNAALLKTSGLSNFPINFATKAFDISSTVEYYGAVQNIAAQPYGNLLISAAGVKTAATAFSVAGNLMMTDGTLNTNATVVTHSIAGNFIMSGSSALTGTNSTYQMNGTTDQTLLLLSSPAKLAVNKTTGSVILGGDITVSSNLHFSKGNINTGTYNVIIPTAATVTGSAQSTGWVNGNMKRDVTVGSNVSRSFAIGGSSYYAPVTLLFASVTTAGDVLASTVSNDHAEVDYSGIDIDKDVNRYWLLDNQGTVFTSVTSTFNWETADMDAGSTTTIFKTGIFNGTAWTLPTISTRTSNSIEATGITTLGEFAVGEKLSQYTWNGNDFTSDWFTPKNWKGGVPTTDDNVLIPNGLSGGRVYPLLAGSTGAVKDLDIESSASLTVTGTLQLAGNATNNGTFSADAGTIEFNGTLPQTIPAGLFSNNALQNLVISNDVSLADTDTLTGTLTIAAGKTLATNDNLVLKSTANGTARIATLPVDGSGNATAFITGNVSIERHIPARKAWRLLSAPIKSIGGASINSAWQEGVNGASLGDNPNPGYGVHITGGTLTNGFDQSPTNSASIKVMNGVGTTFAALPATPGTNAAISTYPGYMVYIRGDRSIDLSQGVNAAVTATTLRVRGQVNTGNQQVSVNAAGFSVLGNPFPSAIDFQTLTRNNVKNTFYIWDPKLAGSNGLGGYVTASWNNTTSQYDFTSSASPVSQYIPSGEAVLVESADGINPGTMVIHESDKTANGSDALFGRTAVNQQKLNIHLMSNDEDGTEALLDAALVTYQDQGNNKVNHEDAGKLNGDNENLSLQREGKGLSIERRKTISQNDTLFLQLNQLKAKEYKMEIVTTKLKNENLYALVKDAYSKTTNDLPVDLDGKTSFSFSVNADPASMAADRFSIVFIKGQLPVVKTRPVVSNLGRMKVQPSADKTIPAMNVYPNPVTGTMIAVQLNNIPKGIYTLKVVNGMGQVVSMKKIELYGGNVAESIEINNVFPAGRYELKLEGVGMYISTAVLKN